MTKTSSPSWIRALSAAIGCAALVMSGFCFFAPVSLFGTDAYHLWTRVAVGLLGAMLAGSGLTAIMAAVDGDPISLKAVVLASFVASALTPPLIIYNIGAFNQTDPTGWYAFGLAGGVILGVSVPLLLSLRVLSRLRRTAKQ